MNNSIISGKTILVTGANRGIGKGFVEHLVALGAKRIYAAGRNLESVEDLAQSAPDIIQPVLLDVTNPNHIQGLLETVKELDILVNNAGIANGCMNTSPQAVSMARMELETNLFGPMNITTLLLPVLKQSKDAAIINISSIAGISNFPACGPYSITKSALHSYTQGIRAELKQDNVFVMGVYPGPIDTRLAAGMEMDKPQPIQVAKEVIQALEQREEDVFTDDFAKHMYASFLEHPKHLEEAFGQSV